MTLTGLAADGTDATLDLLAVDRALDQLRAMDARKARVVELRFFGGLEVEEVAEVIGVSAVTVMRDWRFSKAWLGRELRDGPESPSPAAR